MKIVVTGGRDYHDKALLNSVLEELKPTEISHGGARGADRLAKEFAIEYGIPQYEFPADWDTYGRAAGPKRNAFMLDLAQPDLVVAFPGGRGTADCVRQARQRNIPIKIIGVDQ